MVILNHSENNNIPIKNTRKSLVYKLVLEDKILHTFSDKEIAMGVAHGFNHYYCKPNFPDKYKIIESHE